MQHHRMPAALLPLVLALAAAHARADVRILEDFGAGAFVTIQQAVDAAPDGSTLLVGPGDYGAFTILGKSLTLVRIPSGPLEIGGPVRVEGLAPGQVVSFHDLTLRGHASLVQASDALQLIHNDGAVRLYTCRVYGGLGLAEWDDEWRMGYGGDAVEIASSTDVAFLDCELRAGEGGGSGGAIDDYGGWGGIGIRATDSAVALYDTECMGGAGGHAGYAGGDGGAGFIAGDTGLFASRSSFIGGRGGDALDWLDPEPGDGGDGLWVSLHGSARLLGNTYQG